VGTAAEEERVPVLNTRFKSNAPLMTAVAVRTWRVLLSLVFSRDAREEVLDDMQRGLTPDANPEQRAGCASMAGMAWLVITVAVFVVTLIPFLVILAKGPQQPPDVMPVLPLVLLPFLTAVLISVRLVLVVVDHVRFRRLTEEQRASWRPTRLTRVAEPHDADFYVALALTAIAAYYIWR
jgi:hypothetical protein